MIRIVEYSKFYEFETVLPRNRHASKPLGYGRGTQMRMLREASHCKFLVYDRTVDMRSRADSSKIPRNSGKLCSNSATTPLDLTLRPYWGWSFVLNYSRKLTPCGT